MWSELTSTSQIVTRNASFFLPFFPSIISSTAHCSKILAESIQPRSILQPDLENNVTFEMHQQKLKLGMEK